MTTFGQRRHSRSRPRPRDFSWWHTQSGQQLAAICILSPVSFCFSVLVIAELSYKFEPSVSLFSVYIQLWRVSERRAVCPNSTVSAVSPASPDQTIQAQRLPENAALQTSGETSLVKNFNRWPGPTLLIRKEKNPGITRANSVGIARFSDSDSFPIHFFPRPDIKLNPFDSDRPCTRLCRHNKVGPGHLLKFSLNSIPKSAVFRAFLTEFSLNSISKLICLFAGHLLKEESQPSPDSD